MLHQPARKCEAKSGVHCFPSERANANANLCPQTAAGNWVIGYFARFCKQTCKVQQWNIVYMHRHVDGDTQRHLHSNFALTLAFFSSARYWRCHSGRRPWFWRSCWLGYQSATAHMLPARCAAERCLDQQNKICKPTRRACAPTSWFSQKHCCVFSAPMRFLSATNACSLIYSNTLSWISALQQ